MFPVSLPAHHSKSSGNTNPARRPKSSAGGIRYDDVQPGGKLLVFAAEPDRRMKRVSCSLETPYGKAQSRWQYASRSWTWQIAAPCNTRIRLILPSLPARKITLDGKVISAAKELLLENGSHEVKIQW